MAKIKPRVKAPKSADAGEVVEIKTLISHPMESGQRKDSKTGELIPRKIINRFVATYNGAEVLAIDLEPAISANPYIQFSFAVPETGELHLAWTDDDGTVYEDTSAITVG